MDMKRYELTEEQWERIKGLLPLERAGKRGRPRKDDRTMLKGMLWIVQSGAQWREEGTLEMVFRALSAGNDHDSVHAVELLEKVKISGSNVLADRAYGAKAIRDYILEQGARYVILPQREGNKRRATAKQKPHLPQHIFIAGPYIRISAKLPAPGLFISLLTAIFANNPAKIHLVIIPPIPALSPSIQF